MPVISFDRFDGGIDLSRPGNVQGSNRFRQLKNCYVTAGKTVKKRPGARFVWTWGSGVKGLFQAPWGLTGFWGAGNSNVEQVTQAAFNQNVDPYRTTQLSRSGTALDNQINWISTAFRFGQFHYVVAATGTGWRHYYTSTEGSNAITDANCPHGSYALSRTSKIFAISDTGVVRYCKTNDPTVWTADNDAGFLPTDRQSKGAFVPTTLGEFQDNLVVFYSDSAQLWETDVDPNNMQFVKSMGIGTRFAEAHAAVGPDLFFLNPKGVRSLVLSSQGGTGQDIDVGMPVDRMIPGFLATQYFVFSRYIASLGQYWLVNGPQVLVYTFSRTAKVYAWSQYTFPWRIQGVAEYNGRAYVRSEAGDIYVMDEDYPFDDYAEGSVRDPQTWASEMPDRNRRLIECVGMPPMLDFKAPGNYKQIDGIDVIATRSNKAAFDSVDAEYKIDHLYRPDSEEELYLGGPLLLAQLKGDTRSAGFLPLGIMAEALSPRFTHRMPESWELSAILYRFKDLGM